MCLSKLVCFWKLNLQCGGIGKWSLMGSVWALGAELSVQDWCLPHRSELRTVGVVSVRGMNAFGSLSLTVCPSVLWGQSKKVITSCQHLDLTPLSLRKCEKWVFIFIVQIQVFCNSSTERTRAHVWATWKNSSRAKVKGRRTGEGSHLFWCVRKWLLCPLGVSPTAAPGKGSDLMFLILKSGRRKLTECAFEQKGGSQWVCVRSSEGPT